MAYTPWKQKTIGFSDVLRGCKKGTPSSNGSNNKTVQGVFHRFCAITIF